MPSATIKLFLVNGEPKRLRTAELSNWTGKAVAGPRSELESVLAREESQKSGVYFLTGNDPESGKGAVYIGEAECVRDRLKSHLDKDFWNQVVFFTSKDENLTKAHIRYLEGRLIEQSRHAGRAIVQNGQSSGARLPESDREDMEIFLEKVHQLLPVLGVEVLVPVAAPATATTERELLFCEIKGLKATGHLTPNGFCSAGRLPGCSHGTPVIAEVSLATQYAPETKRGRYSCGEVRSPRVQSGCGVLQSQCRGCRYSWWARERAHRVEEQTWQDTKGA
jgi:hypothetical protein